MIDEKEAFLKAFVISAVRGANDAADPHRVVELAELAWRRLHPPQRFAGESDAELRKRTEG